MAGVIDYANDMGSTQARETRTPRTVMILSLAAAGLSAASPAVANQAATEAPGPRAEALKRKAFQHIAEGNLALGIDELKSAYALVPHPTLLFNIAVVYDQWPGHCADALQAFDRFFAACEACGVRATAERRFERVKERCLVALTIRSVPPDADVQVDQRSVGRTPTRVTVRPGPHQVRVQKDAYAVESREVVMAPGRDQALELVLQALPSAPDVPPLVAEGRPSDPLRPWMWAGFATAAVGLAVGAVFTVLAQDSSDREAQVRDQPFPVAEDVRSLRDEARTRSAIAVTSFIAAGVGAAAGATLWWISSDSPAQERRPGPTAGWGVSTDGRQVLVGGRF